VRQVPTDAGIRFGQYVLVRRIARGGMAEVFLAQQRGLEGFDRRVAVKRILPHLADSPDFVKMFFGEARLAAQLSHPNIVHIYEFGKVEHDYFIAMEFVDGVHAGQLFKHGSEGDKLPATLVARIGADAANALHYAHELHGANGAPLGLVHRDVSPANIMVSFDGVVKLCDFGIAKAAAAGDQLTNPGQVKGKYAYMSPEQTIASQLDGRSDVFSLGIVMWELLTGKYIVPRGDAVAAMRAIRDGKLEPIEKAAPHVPAPLASAISWALEPKRDKRATAAELAQALEAFVKSAPELATSMQLGGWIRARFPRETTTGQMPAMNPSTGVVRPSTQMSPGTVVAPGTAVSPGTALSPGTAISPGTLVAPGTPAMGSPITPPGYPPRRSVRKLTDTSDGTEIYSTSDLDDEMAETIKGARPRKHSTSDATEILRRPHVAADEEDSDLGGETIQRETRVIIGGSSRPASASGANARGVSGPATSGAGVNVAGTSSAGTSAGASVAGTSGAGASVAGTSGAGAVPTRVQSAVDSRVYPHTDPRTALGIGPAISDGASRALSEPGARGPVPTTEVIDAAARAGDWSARNGAMPPHLPLGTEPSRRYTPVPGELTRKRRTKLVIAIGGLAGLALLSFAIALAASGTKKQPAEVAAQDATDEGNVVVLAPVDAALPTTPPADAGAGAGAGTAVAADLVDAGASSGATVPTVPTETSARTPDAGLVHDELMASLIVRTIPDGGTIKVGKQSRVATVQRGDPTGAATAQLRLAAGKYTVLAELDGYRPEKRAVVLERGDRQKIEIAFTKRIEKRPDRGPAMGRLTVRTTPWSDVYLGSRKLGQAPFADLELPAGTHTLTFKNPSRPTVTKTVTIKPGKSAKLNFNLP